MKILLVTPPSYLPTVMSYSVAMMRSALSCRITDEIAVLDMNALFHSLFFPEFYQRAQNEEFFSLLNEFSTAARTVYAQISKDVLHDKKPILYQELLDSILCFHPNVVAFSLVYNSQISYSKPLIQDLVQRGIRVIVGGPADYSKIVEGAIILPDEKKLAEYLISNGATPRTSLLSAPIDYSIFSPSLYFTPSPVYPLRTSHSCPYKRCTFCTHHGNAEYRQMDLGTVSKAITHNSMKKICFIDDDFPPQRLLAIAEMLHPLHVSWWCQLRPTKQILSLLPQLRKCGLSSVAWGVESGCQRTLDRMEKGTRIPDIEAVLAKSAELGIRNITYIMFGLPGETREEFMETVSFLEKNSKNVDLISSSVFGLQHGSRIHSDPTRFGVRDVRSTERTLLGPSVSYAAADGLSPDEVSRLKKKVQARLLRINKVPRIIAAYKEQILNYAEP